MITKEEILEEKELLEKQLLVVLDQYQENSLLINDVNEVIKTRFNRLLVLNGDDEDEDEGVRDFGYRCCY